MTDSRDSADVRVVAIQSHGRGVRVRSEKEEKACIAPRCRPPGYPLQVGVERVARFSCPVSAELTASTPERELIRAAEKLIIAHLCPVRVADLFPVTPLAGDIRRVAKTSCVSDP